MTTPMAVKVKLFPWWCTSKTQSDIFKDRLLPPTGKFIASNICLELTESSKDADFHVVLCRPNNLEIPDPSKTILLCMEPKTAHSGIYGKWLSPSPSDFRYLLYRNATEWHLKRSYDELKKDLAGDPLPKTKVISAVISAMQNDHGQRLRYAFIKYLEQIPGFEFYGRDHSDSKNYLGPLPYYCKDKALLDSKYSFAAENCQEYDYFTEKLIDSILCECLTFYWGCPNIDKYLDPRAYIRLDISKPDEAIAIIKKAIAEDEYTKRLPYIRAAKSKIIDELQIAPTLCSIIRNIIDVDDALIKSGVSLPKCISNLNGLKQQIVLPFDVTRPIVHDNNLIYLKAEKLLESKTTMSESDVIVKSLQLYQDSKYQASYDVLNSFYNSSNKYSIKYYDTLAVVCWRVGRKYEGIDALYDLLNSDEKLLSILSSEDIRGIMYKINQYKDNQLSIRAAQVLLNSNDRRQHFKYKSIIFCNDANLGDVFLVKEFVRHVVTNIPADKYIISHKYGPKIYTDIKGIDQSTVGTAGRKLVGKGDWEVSDNSLIINTWIMTDNGKYHPNDEDLGVSSLFLMFKTLLKRICYYDLPGVDKDYLPSVDYKMYSIEPIDKFITEHTSRKRVLICSGVVLSGQALNLNLSDTWARLAKENPTIDFILTNAWNEVRIKLDNIFYTADIIKETFDLIEISYLASKCDIVIGKGSGPSTYCLNKYTLSSNCKFVAFTHKMGYFSGGMDTLYPGKFAWYADINAKDYHYNIINKHIEEQLLNIRRQHVKYNSIIFCNDANLGDIFLAKEFIRHIVTNIPADKYIISHKYGPKIYTDIKGIDQSMVGVSSRKSVGQKDWEVSNNSLIINTWIMADNGKYCQDVGIPCLFLMFKTLLKRICYYDLPGEAKDYLPCVDYKMYSVEPINKFVSERSTRKRVLICGNIVLSGQALNIDLSDTWRRLAAENPGIDFILTNAWNEVRIKLDNIFYTADIIKETFDLIEISYLAAKCDIVIGKGSGPSTYCLNKYTLSNNCKFIAFTQKMVLFSGGVDAWYPGKFAWYADINAKDYHYNIINKHLKE